MFSFIKKAKGKTQAQEKKQNLHTRKQLSVL